MTDLLKQLDAAAELGKKATKRPWHWHPCGEKCYSFVLGAGVSMTDGEVLPPGRIETERYNEAIGQYETLAFINDFVAESNQQSGDRDFAYIAAACSLDHAAIAAAWRAKDAEIERLQAIVAAYRAALTPPSAGATP